MKLQPHRHNQTPLECADLSALWGGGTCPDGWGDESPNRKAVTSHRTPRRSRFSTISRATNTKQLGAGGEHGCSSRLANKSAAGFTMVEIAICLAIIGFALVAIIGVLPAGLNVQKENREETIIDQDATYWANAIRTGARGLDELTNYVESIIVSRSQMRRTQGGSGGVEWGYGTVSTRVDVYTNRTPNPTIVLPTPSSGQAYRLINGWEIIGLLSTPRYENLQLDQGIVLGYTSNYVAAYVRAISGAAVDKGVNSGSREFAFHYRLVPEIVPATWAAMMNLPASQRLDTNHWVHLETTAANLHDFRLLFRWPVLPGKDQDFPDMPRIGSGRQVYKTLVGGRLEGPLPIFDILHRPDPYFAPTNSYFFQPNTYAKIAQP